jgi:hypothetical protein
MDIIPIPLNDQQIPLSTIRICTYFIVSARLDEGLLQTSLDGLIRHHWRKLGARVVKGASGWLEYHLPKKFDDNYALFNWSSTQNGALMADAAPILRKITKPSTESVGFLPGLSEVESVLRPGHWPLNRDDEPRDSPLFYVHLSKFADTTVVGLNFPHLFADQLGLSTIMKAWLGLAAGQTPPPMVGYDEDVLPQREFSSFSRPEIQRTGMMRVRWPMEYYVVILGLILELVFNPKEMRHTIFLPRWLVDKVHEQSSKVSEEEPGMEHKLTRGDIITAIMIKVR